MITAALAILQTDEQRTIISDFYQKNKNRFYAIAYEHLHDPQDSEEAIQETFFRIAVDPDKFFSLSGDGRIYFVSAIIRNVSIDMYNKKTKHQLEELPEDLIYRSDPEFLENSLLEKISHEELLDFINDLPELQRNVLILTCLSELSISETAETLGVSKTVVNQRLYLARKSIRSFIERKRHE